MGDEPTAPKLGDRLADAVHRGRVRSRADELELEHEAKTKWLHGFMEYGEGELAPIVERLWRDILADPDAAPHFRSVLEQGADPTHQLDFLLNIVLTIVGVASNIGAYSAPFVQRLINEAWVRHPDRPLTPDALAVAVLKGQMDFSTAFGFAAESGISESAFQTLVDASGNPPGPEQLLVMLNRQIIDAGRFTEGIREGRFRLDWAAELEGLRYGPPSPALAVEAAVQNQIDAGGAQAILAKQGIDPAYFDLMFRTAGRPPGIMEMIGLLNRGVVDQAAVEQAIRESNIKDKYVATLLNLREHLLPQKTIVAGVHQGVIPDPIALGELAKLGISAQNSAYLIQEGHANKAATTHALSVSTIVDAYEAGMLSRADALAHLETLRFNAADAALELDLADARILLAVKNALVSRVRTQYLSHKVTRVEASGELDKIGVDAAKRDALLELWTVVLSTPTKTLTLAQLSSAYKKKIISATTFKARVLALGYTADDFEIIHYLEGAPPPATPL